MLKFGYYSFSLSSRVVHNLIKICKVTSGFVKNWLTCYGMTRTGLIFMPFELLFVTEFEE
jgi:hypothetical protein